MSTASGSNLVKDHGGQHPFRPIVIGLTGSIGMGKSTITKQFRRLGIPVFDADEAVHSLYAPGGEAVAPLGQLFPEAVVEGGIERSKLSTLILSNPSLLQAIEKIVHPLVAKRRERFYQEALQRQDLFIVYDIPLLFESRSSYDIDYTLVVSANPDIQRQRVLKRPGMTEAKFQSILAKQLPDEVKCQRADFVIRSDYESYSQGRAQLALVLEQILVKERERFHLWNSRDAQRNEEEEEERKERSFDVVIFDLDDTLCPSSGPLRRAYKELQSYLMTYCPKVWENIESQVPELMHKVKMEQPLIAHDLTEVRRQVLLSALTAEGAEHHLPTLMESFLKTRSNLSEFLYEDTLPCLKYFKENKISTHVLTNGNAQNTTLHGYVDLFLTSGDVGASKPSPIGFLACSWKLGMPCHRILYVGDSYEKDIHGAKAVGMKTALLLRDISEDSIADVNKEELYPAADVILTNLQPDYLRRILVPTAFTKPAEE
eukprot:gene10967-12194_t